MTMTAAPHSIDPATYLDDLLAQASPDVMRQRLQGFINQILSAQADTVCGAEYGVASAAENLPADILGIHSRPLSGDLTPFSRILRLSNNF